MRREISDIHTSLPLLDGVIIFSVWRERAWQHSDQISRAFPKYRRDNLEGGVVIRWQAENLRGILSS